MTGTAPASGRRSPNERLAERFKKEKFRKSYFARQLKVFLAAQIRALRGERTQTEFGELIGKPQSVVARLERESYGKVNIQTLIDIATKLDIALIVRFVSFPTFLEWTSDYSPKAFAPESYPSEVKRQPTRKLRLRARRIGLFGLGSRGEYIEIVPPEGQKLPKPPPPVIHNEAGGDVISLQ
jgi:transcriptional regulator with XRE-family HTH domain